MKKKITKSRRRFIQKAAAITGAGLVGSYQEIGRLQTGFLLDRINEYHDHSSLNTDEDFWSLVKQSYTVSPTILNLNNGGVSPQPRVVQEAVERYNQLSNEAPSYYMWRILDQGREPLRAKLADLAGCSADEIAINRNSTEALETVIFGLRMEKGDEVILTRQDYPNMINAWKQREKRDGIKLIWLDFDLPVEDEEFVVDEFMRHITPRTRLVHITHMINWTGQILPAAKISKAARERGVESLVDAAHSFAHVDYKIPDLDCDYFGTSLHKWLCAPFGSGMLYVRKEKIAKLYPLFGSEDPEADDIRKFESLGTRSFAIEQAIGQAVDFHLMIGGRRKAGRLQYLKNYWAEQARSIPGVEIGTSLDPRFACALCLIRSEALPAEDLSERLFSDHKIHTVAINWEKIRGVRVTPNVYTLKSDLDRFLEALHSSLKT